MKKEEKLKVGRPKLADKKTKNNALTLLTISFLFVVGLVVVGFDVLFKPNLSIEKIKGEVSTTATANNIETYSLVLPGKEANLCDVRLLSLSGKTIKYQIRCQANARPVGLTIKSNGKSETILQNFKMHNGFFYTGTYSVEDGVSKDATLNLYYKKQDVSGKDYAKQYKISVSVYVNGKINKSIAIPSPNTSKLPDDKCTISVDNVTSSMFSWNVKCDSGAKPKIISLETSYKEKNGSQVAIIKNNYNNKYGITDNGKVTKTLSANTEYNLVLYFDTKQYDYYRTSVTFKTPSVTAKTNSSTTVNSDKTNKAITTVKTTTKATTTTVKTDITCPTFTYSKDGKTFTSSPASVYNSSKVYVKISMDASKYTYNKWYWYADNRKGGFTKYSTTYDKNNEVVNITAEGNRTIRVQVFNTNTKKSINCDTKTIVIDRTPPKCPTISVSGTKANSTWYKTNVTLNIKPTSDTSKWEWYTIDSKGKWVLKTKSNVGIQKKSLTTNGKAQQGKIVVYDKAGNKKECLTGKYNIDKTLAYVTGKLVHPTKNKGSWSAGTKTSSDHLHYSKAYGSAWHGGNDIVVNKGTTVVAMDGGEVIKADTTTNKCSSKSNCKSEGYVHFGKYVLMKHVIDNKTYYTVYGHLNKISVKVGDKIKQGTKIGESGNTGNSSGPHLHVGMSYNKYDNNGYPIYSKNVIAPYEYISGSKKGKTYVGDKGKNK